MDDEPVGTGAWGWAGGVAPPDLQVRRMELSGDPVLVLTFPVPSRQETAPLTDAERDVVRRALEGAPTSAIAAARRTSPRTVANQLQSIFRKLGIASRAELARCYAGMPASRR